MSFVQLESERERRKTKKTMINDLNGVFDHLKV